MDDNDKTEENFKGIWISAEILAREDLSPTEKLALAQIHALAKGNGLCTAGNAYFAARLCIKENTASLVLKSLAQKKFVELIAPNGKRRIITPIFPFPTFEKNQTPKSLKKPSTFEKNQTPEILEKSKVALKKIKGSFEKNQSPQIIKDNKAKQIHRTVCDGGVGFEKNQTSENATESLTLESISETADAENEKHLEDGFADFWAKYPRECPRRMQKAHCLAFWKQNRLAGKLAAVMAALENWKQTDDWKRGGGQYICAPLVWLRKKPWLDIEEAAAGGNDAQASVDLDAQRTADLRRWKALAEKVEARVANGWQVFPQEWQECNSIAEKYPSAFLPVWNDERKKFE